MSEAGASRAISRLNLDWLQVEVSSLCDGACTYCPQQCLRDQWQGGLMKWRTFERLEPSFPHTNLVYLQGWGEPLLHPDIWRMVRRVRESGVAAGFTTNGARLDAGNLKRMMESELNVVGVSLAGATPATHERFRPTCKFQQIDEALTTLGEWKREKRSEHPQVHLAFLLLRSNLDEVPALVNLASRWGASQVVVSNLSWVATAEMREECTLFHPETWPRATEVLEQAKREAARRGMLLHYHGPGIGEPHPICTENVLKACFVSHRGEVSPCVLASPSFGAAVPLDHDIWGQSRRAEPIVFGNVRDQSLAEIWSSPEACEFRRVFRDRLSKAQPGTGSLPQACAGCYRLRERQPRSSRSSALISGLATIASRLRGWGLRW